MTDFLGIHDFGLFVATVLVLNATPGVDMVLTVGRTLRHGWQGGMAAAAGIVAGCGVHALAAAFGLAALLGASATAFTVLKWVGAVYLAWLAVGMLTRAWRGEPSAAAACGPASDAARDPASRTAHPAAMAADGRGPRVSLAALFREGLLCNVLNPKVALFFLALLPQFIDAASAHKTLAFIVLGGIVLLQSVLFLAALVLVAARLRRAAPRPLLQRGLNGLGGLLFFGLAARLALSERP